MDWLCELAAERSLTSRWNAWAASSTRVCTLPDGKFDVRWDNLGSGPLPVARMAHLQAVQSRARGV